MNISPLSSGSPITRLQGSKAVNNTQGSQDVNTPAQDTVEISSTARYLSELKNLPVRQDKVDAARSAIANGTYETPDKLNAVTDQLLQEFA